MIERIQACFSKEEINFGRQPELDLAKGFAILFMVWVHVTEMFVDTESGVMPQIVEHFLGGPFAAPVFMICMGIGIVYSRHNAPKDLLKRGITLLFIGLVLDFFRTLLPDIIDMMITKDFSWLSYVFFSLVSVDILQFAGLAFLFFAMVKKCRITDKTMVLLAIGGQIAGMLLRYQSTGNDLVDGFAGYLWGTETNTYFPFFNWIVFPVAGVMLGKLYRHLSDKETIYRMVSPWAFLLGLGYLIAAYQFGFGMFSESSSYFFMGIVDVAFVLLLAVGVFGMDHFILKLFHPFRFHTLMRLAKNINTVYCIHWVLITYLVNGVFFFMDREPGFWFATAFAAMILLLSDGMAVIWIRIKKRCRNHWYALK